VLLSKLGSQHSHFTMTARICVCLLRPIILWYGALCL
jgi:hypothetical protein